MATTILDFRMREEMVEAVLKEMAALEPTERLREANSFVPIMSQVMQNLEELWDNLSRPLERGVSLADAASLARMLTRSPNIIGSCLELLSLEGPALEEFKEANMTRLQRIKAHAASLRRFVDMPVPAPEPERLRRSLEQMSRGEGVDAEDFAAEIKG